MAICVDTTSAVGRTTVVAEGIGVVVGMIRAVGMVFTCVVGVCVLAGVAVGVDVGTIVGVTVGVLVGSAVADGVTVGDAITATFATVVGVVLGLVPTMTAGNSTPPVGFTVGVVVVCSCALPSCCRSVGGVALTTGDGRTEGDG
jgi:hypothetical protein